MQETLNGASQTEAALNASAFAASSAHLGTWPGDTRFLHFCDIRGMNHNPQILLEATLKQISDACDCACALNLFALSSREAAGDSNTKKAAPGLICFQTLSFFSFICCQGCAFSSLLLFREPKALGAASSSQALLSLMQNVEFSDKVTSG